ncbi:hypothetical protein JTE90_009762 [Oedothorax gibbosus]|uniref:Uncharacterized protein n=1 Tax=Oedothorax gibbosus TaxID=931172 RepID=A0AAV6V8Y7_9ARAC|nr:hypothetical protein JTE90_009762 [Oedothorax gibbosus]
MKIVGRNRVYEGQIRDIRLIPGRGFTDDLDDTVTLVSGSLCQGRNRVYEGQIRDIRRIPGRGFTEEGKKYVDDTVTLGSGSLCQGRSILPG